MRTNREGLTWSEWLAAARVKSSPLAFKAWQRGEEPTGWTVGK